MVHSYYSVVRVETNSSFYFVKQLRDILNRSNYFGVTLKLTEQLDDAIHVVLVYSLLMVSSSVCGKVHDKHHDDMFVLVDFINTRLV